MSSQPIVPHSLDSQALVGWVILFTRLPRLCEHETSEAVEVRAEADAVEVLRLTPRGLAALIAAGEARPGGATPPVRFPLGFVAATPGALTALTAAGQSPDPFLARHQAGDWGDLSAHDRQENELSLREGFRLLSAYRLASGVKLWIITEADRSGTTLLLPEEY